MGSTKPTIVLVGEDNIDVISLRKQLELEKGLEFLVEKKVLGFEQLFDFIKAATGSLLVLLDMSRNPEKAFWIAQQIKREFPKIHLVMTATDNHPATVARAKRSGAEDFLLLQPLKWVEVFQTLDKIMEKMKREDSRPGDQSIADSGPQALKEDVKDTARTDAVRKELTEKPGIPTSGETSPPVDKQGPTSGLAGKGPEPEPSVSVASSQKPIDGRDGLMQGLFSQIRVIDVLQLAILAKKSGLLKLTRGKEVVDVFIVKGEIVHAISPMGQGEKALFYPLTWTEGTFTLLANPSTPQRTIAKPTAQLLAELLAVHEEWDQIRQVIPQESAVFHVCEVENLSRQAQSITFSPEEWAIFTKVDGSRSVKSIAEILHLSYFDVAKTIHKFQRGELVKTVSPSASPARSGPNPPPAAPVVKGLIQNGVPAEFFKRMIDGLADVLGPISPIIVRNQITALGESPEAFPSNRLGELIDSVSQQIPDKKQKTRFLEKMREEIRTLKTP